MNDSGLQREIAAISTEAMDLGMAMDELATFVRSHPVDHSATAWMIRKGAEEFKRLSSRLGSLSPETPSTDSQVLPPPNSLCSSRLHGGRLVKTFRAERAERVLTSWLEWR